MASTNLNQNYSAQVFAVPVLPKQQREFRGEFGRFAGIEPSHRDQAANHAGVGQSAADIFAPADIARQRVFGDGQQDFDALGSGRELLDGEPEDRRIFPDQRYGGVGGRGGAPNLTNGSRAIGTIKFGLSVHDHLGCVYVFDAQGRGIFLLAVGVQMSGKAIGPSELIPVIDVLAKNDNIGFWYRPFLLETDE